ncbi:MAG: hypothetical protein QOD53_2438 [Thermoleophilaceae bacterium]|nr:hypothetical protein [Thermoleophilaceae bacterium]
MLGAGHQPPGFHVDESAIAYNALSIAEHGRDEHGAAWPVFFESYGDYKSAPYIYLLAAVLKLTGPSIVAARALSALVGFAAVALLALVAARESGRAVVASAIGVSAALTPWLFEPSRLVFEVVLVPAVVAGLLLVLLDADRRPRWGAWHSVGAGLLLGLLTYSYQSGRLLGPALALGLVLFARRGHWRGVAVAWFVYAVTLAPLALFAIRHPGALEARFKTSSYLDDGLPLPTVLGRFAGHYLNSFSPSRLLLHGDPNPRHHLQFLGSMLAATVVLAIVGLVVVLRERRGRPWWRFVLWGLVVAPLPGALTVDRFHTLRLVAMPVFMLVLAAAGAAWLWRSGARQQGRRAALAALLALTVFQGVAFQVRFHRDNDQRAPFFDAEYPAVLDAAERASPSGRFYSLAGTEAHCLWYSALERRDRSLCARVPPSGLPAGSVAASQYVLDCRGCRQLRVIGGFAIYRVEQRLRLP